MSQLRLYSFVNFYLSSIQQGVQSAHLIGNMSVKYHDTFHQPATDYWAWAACYKTLIILNGGANLDIVVKYKQIEEIASQLAHSLPYGCFYEDEYSLGGVMTCCGIVVPEDLYEAVPHSKLASMNLKGEVPCHAADFGSWYYIVDDMIVKTYKASSPEARLINLIKSCGLAR